MTSPGFTWTSSALTHVGLARTKNEDAVYARPEFGLWAVADGMGGHLNGEVASGLIVESLAKLKPQPELSMMVEFIEHALVEVNRQLLDLAFGTSQTIGSTVVVLAAVGRHVALLWAGDSRIYRARAQQLVQLTTDHSQAEMLVALGIMPWADAVRHPQAQHLTRAVGAHPTLRLELEICAVEPGDRFLLCSDGLEKHLSPIEIAEYLSARDLNACTDGLLALTLARGAGDNVTVCVVECA